MGSIKSFLDWVKGGERSKPRLRRTETEKMTWIICPIIFRSI